jgi:hypothetical protein
VEYSRERPSEDGFYFVKGGDLTGWVETVVQVDSDFGQVFFEGEWLSLIDFERSFPTTEWAGPIQSPD